ncbi:MAG TPA: iron-containing redox enzyme family protein [Gaiellaceae bacterium]|nr:iron-containing redox enzyme family protein [Gaiellaceae bacterium]
MVSACERARSLAAGDPVAAGLVGYLERHAAEEMHGDEPGAGLAADLIALGVDESRLRARQPSPKLAALIGAEFFWIHHLHPVAILGSLELEAHQANAHQVERLIAATGLPRDGFRQLLLHAELDVGHAEELHGLIDSLPLEPWHEQLIGLSALQTIALATEALLDVVHGEAG